MKLRQSREVSRRGHAAKTQAAFGAKAKTSDKVYLCIDCGYIYDGRVPFSELGKDYICPVCQAPKRRYDTTDMCPLSALFISLQVKGTVLEHVRRVATNF